MKITDRVRYSGKMFNDLTNITGIIIRQFPNNPDIMWAVDFGKDVGIRNCLEINLKKMGGEQLCFDI